MRRYSFLTLLLFVISLQSINCKKENESSAAPNYDGTWTGTTSQSKALSFTVSGNKITSITIAYSLSGNCSPNPTGATVTLNSGNSISGNSFTITGGTAVSGAFSSANAASGSFSINFTGNPPGCSSTASGTWTATK